MKWLVCKRCTIKGIRFCGGCYLITPQNLSIEMGCVTIRAFCIEVALRCTKIREVSKRELIDSIIREKIALDPKI